MLLRLTLGRSGGMIKMATSGEGNSFPAYPDSGRLISAMGVALLRRARGDVPLDFREDSNGRPFVEIGAKGDRDTYVFEMQMIKAEIVRDLGLSTK